MRRSAVNSHVGMVRYDEQETSSIVGNKKAAMTAAFLFAFYLIFYRWSCGTVTVVLAVDLLPEASVAE